jgi:capsular exopolysaccharide synthesis family protein
MSTSYIEKAVDALYSDESKEKVSESLYSSDSLDIIKPKLDTSKDFAYTKSSVFTASDKHLRKNRVLTPGMDKATVTAYKILRTRVLQSMEQNGWSTLAITSPKPNEGKSVTAINLSISVAQKLDHTVLLVDLDFRRPSIHKYFGFEPNYELRDYLEGQVSLEEVFVNPGIKRLLLLPARGVEGNSSEILSSSKMERLVTDLKNRYPSRIVIFDLPPVLVGDDVLAFSKLVDAMLLVTREGKTTKDELQRTVDLLETTNLLGTVLNRSSAEDKTLYTGY